MSTLGAIGVDLGSQNVVIGCAKKGGIEIITNEGSNRETPFIVGYGPNERFIGEQGAVQLKSNFKNTVVYPLRFLGMKGNSAHLEYESKFIYNKLTTLPDNKVGFTVSYQGETRTLLPEQIVATMLQKIKDIVHKSDIAQSDFVLTVPSYFTEPERRALLDAAKIAGINVVRLLNEHSAIALSYGLFRKAELDVNPRNVLFVDVGHSNTSVFLAGFTKDKVTILDQYHERCLGARDIDWILLEHYSKMFHQANNLNPMKNDKARLRMLDAIEKQRKILSANSEANISLEYLMEDCDLHYTLTREQYEQLISPVVSKLRETLLKINLSKYPIHSIEIIGGATRIPIIQKTIQDICGKQFFKTMFATECIARGAATMAAIMSPLFKVSDYVIDDPNFYPIRCSWKFHETAQSAKDSTTMDIEDSRNNISKQNSILFDAGCHLPNTKSINFHREDAVEFKLFYDPVPFGAEETIATYLIDNTKPQCPDFKVKLRVQLSKNGLLEFESSQLIEEWEEDEGKLGGSGEKKMKNKSFDIKTEILFRHGLSLSQLQDLIQEETKMANSDKLILETYNLKNLLESYIYEARRNINEKYKTSAVSSAAEEFLGKLAETEQWLYGDGAKAKKEEYVQHIESLKDMEYSIQQKLTGSNASFKGQRNDQRMDFSNENANKINDMRSAVDGRSQGQSTEQSSDRIDIEE